MASTPGKLSIFAHERKVWKPCNFLCLLSPVVYLTQKQIVFQKSFCPNKSYPVITVGVFSEHKHVAGLSLPIWQSSFHRVLFLTQFQESTFHFPLTCDVGIHTFASSASSQLIPQEKNRFTYCPPWSIRPANPTIYCFYHRNYTFKPYTPSGISFYYPGWYKLNLNPQAFSSKGLRTSLVNPQGLFEIWNIMFLIWAEIYTIRTLKFSKSGLYLNVI